MKKICLALLTVILCFCFVGCGEPNMNPGITSTDLLDNTENQQRWLRYPGSKLVINPDNYSGTANENNFLHMPLNVGIIDDEGKVTDTINDALFFMETNSSNGKGGEVIFTGCWTKEGINFNVPKGQLEYEPIGETGVRFWIPAGSTNNAVMMTYRKALEMDFDQDIILNVNVIECVGMISLKGALEPQHDIRTTGLLSYNLTEFSGYTGKKKLILGVYAIEPGNPVAIDLYEVRQIPKGFHYGKDFFSTWAPYSLLSNISFENGTALSVKDIFATENTIVRQITGIEKGTTVLAGKYTGKLEYDNKKGCIIINRDGYKYSITTKRKTNFRCFANEEDLKSNKNEITENYPESGYWLINFGMVNPDDSAYVAITVDKDNTMTADEMYELGKEFLTDKKFEEAYNTRIESWDEYLRQNEITPDYILNFPKE